MSFEQVREFHEKFGHPVRLGGATASADDIDIDLLNLRVRLIAEEFFELIEAVYGKAYADMWESMWVNTGALREENNGYVLNRDIVEIADALGDIKYVVNGMALALGIDLPAVENEIHRSNMSKLGADGEPVVSDGTDGFPKGKILKGANYTPPNVADIIRQHPIR